VDEPQKYVITVEISDSFLALTTADFTITVKAYSSEAAQTGST
jgi:hypothetical protein